MFPTQGQVAHALLTRPPLSSIAVTPKGSNKRTPFDLNVLCTPPAFILSQDQTLESLYLISVSRVQICSSAFSSFSYFCLSCICSLRNFRVPFLHILLCLYFSLRCSIFNDRFAALFRDSFVIIPHLFPFVNTFFKSFFDFFQDAVPLPFSRDSLPIISHRSPFVNTFF